MHALLIDDSKANRLVINSYMTELGFKVTEARDGLEGLHALKNNPTVNVILLDWEMPGMNGLEFQAKVRADPSKNDLPIIMISSNDSHEKITKTLQTGADEYLVKPISREDLESKLELLGIEPEEGRV